MKGKRYLYLGSLIILLNLAGCKTVKFFQRKNLGDPIMEVRGSSRNFAEGKVFSSREGSSGASGASAGGGCGCY